MNADATETKNNNINQRWAWASIGVIVILMILSQIDRNSISLMVDPIRKTFNIGDVEISLLQGPAFAVFFLLGSILVGWLVDRYSRRWLIYIGVTIWSFATVLSGLANDFYLLIAARSFVGLGESVLQPAGWSMMASWFPARKLATAIGVLTASSQLGTAISFMLVGSLMANGNPFLNTSIPILSTLEPWQFAFIATGIPGVFIALLIFAVPRDSATTKTINDHTDESFVAFIKEKKIYLICHFLGFGILSIAVHGAASWAPTYLMRIHHIDVKQISVFVGLLVIPLGVGGAIFAGWLVDRSFQKGARDAHLSHFAFRCLAIALLGSIGFALDSSLIIPVICFGCIQFLQPFSGVAGASLQISTPEHLRGRISGIFIMFYNAVGMIFGPSVIALLSTSSGSGDLGFAMSINYLVFGSAAAALLWFGRKYAVAAVQPFTPVLTKI